MLFPIEPTPDQLNKMMHDPNCKPDHAQLQFHIQDRINTFLEKSRTSRNIVNNILGLGFQENNPLDDDRAPWIRTLGHCLKCHEERYQHFPYSQSQLQKKSTGKRKQHRGLTFSHRKKTKAIIQGESAKSSGDVQVLTINSDSDSAKENEDDVEVTNDLVEDSVVDQSNKDQPYVQTSIPVNDPKPRCNEPSNSTQSRPGDVRLLESKRVRAIHRSQTDDQYVQMFLSQTERLEETYSSPEEYLEALVARREHRSTDMKMYQRLCTSDFSAYAISMIATYAERVYPPIGDLLIAQIERMKQRWIIPEHRREVEQLSNAIDDSAEQYVQIPGSTELFPKIREVAADDGTTYPEFNDWPTDMTQESIANVDKIFTQVAHHPNVPLEKFQNFLDQLHKLPDYRQLTLDQTFRYVKIVKHHGAEWLVT